MARQWMDTYGPSWYSSRYRQCCGALLLRAGKLDNGAGDQCRRRLISNESRDPARNPVGLISRWINQSNALGSRTVCFHGQVKNFIGTIRVLQLNVPLAAIYCVVNQNVESSTGSTV